MKTFEINPSLNTDEKSRGTCKTTYLLAFLLVSGISLSDVNATPYYYKGTGSVNAVASYASNPDGTGSAPANFTTAGNTFVIQNTQTPTASTTWTVSGTGSGVLVQTGGTLNISGGTQTYSLSLQDSSNVVATGSYSTVTLGTVSSTSNFSYAGTSNSAYSDRAYGNFTWGYTGTGGTSLGDIAGTTGNLTINTSGGETRVATGTTGRTWNVGKDLIVSANVLNLNNGTGAAVINLGGGLTNNGTLSKSAAGSAAINFIGSGSSTAKWGTIATGTNFNVTVGSGKTMTFNDALTNGSGTVGVTGTLKLGSSSVITNTGGVTVNNGGSLLGSGSISSPVSVLSGGKIGNGGDTIATTLNTGALTLSSGSTTSLDIFSSSSGDRLVSTGAFTYGGTLALTLTGTASTTPISFDLFDFTSRSGTSTFSSITATGYDSSQISFNYNTGTVTLTAVPEPATILGGVVLLGMIVMRERRKFGEWKKLGLFEVKKLN